MLNVIMLSAVMMSVVARSNNLYNCNAFYVRFLTIVQCHVVLSIIILSVTICYWSLL